MPVRTGLRCSGWFQKIFVFLTNDGLVTSFKQVSALMMFTIEILAVGLLQALHELGERLFRTLNQQMDVIGHQAISVDSVAVFLAVPSQPLDVRPIVALRSEGLLALIASHDDVIEHPCGEEAWSRAYFY